MMSAILLLAVALIILILTTPAPPRDSVVRIMALSFACAAAVVAFLKILGVV